MTKDVHIISEMYSNIREQQIAPRLGIQQPTPGRLPVQQPVAATPTQQSAPVAAAPVAATTAVNQPTPVTTSSALKATKEQEKAVNDLLKAFGLPENSAQSLLQTLLQGIPALKAQYGIK